VDEKNKRQFERFSIGHFFASFKLRSASAPMFDYPPDSTKKEL
jgi:hypothetical protein